jgi:hypothetical protein
MKVVIGHNNEPILVAESVSTRYCMDCERECLTELLNLTAIGSVCNHCFSSYKKCDECGAYYPAHKTCIVDGQCICDYCYDDVAIVCDRCDEVHLRENIRYTADEYWLCDNCIDNGYGTYCDTCGSLWYYNDDLDYDEDEETYSCPRCEDRVIKSYSYKPSPNFKETDKEPKKCKGEYFGFEIEVAGNRNKAQRFLEEIGEKDLLYLKNDGSVDGFEIVTHPMTRTYFYKEFMPKISKGMSYLKRQCFKGHNSGGIHIHVSEAVINKNMLKRLIVLLYPKSDKSYHTWLAITQRHDVNMSRWSSMRNGVELTYEKKHLFEKIDKSPKGIKPPVTSGRYTAINVCCNTVEFRIFNSNLRPERIAKNAEVIFSLLDFSKTKIMPTMTNYLRYIDKHKKKYKHLFNFLIEKHIYQSIEQKETIRNIGEAVSNVIGRNISPAELLELIEQQNIVTTTVIDDDDERISVCA